MYKSEYELERLVSEAKYCNTSEFELNAYIEENPIEWRNFCNTHKKSQSKNDFEPGSDMHTWATTRFF